MFMRFFSFMAVILLPVTALGQPVPSPSAVTAFNAAVAQFDTDYGLYTTQIATVTSDSAAVTAATTTLNNDTVILNTTGGSISTDLTAIQTAFANLTAAEQAAVARSMEKVTAKRSMFEARPIPEPPVTPVGPTPVPVVVPTPTPNPCCVPACCRRGLFRRR
jgi:hypothetical protein